MELVKLENVTREYRTGEVAVHALNNVDLIIEKGEFTVLAGPSGSGKTTCLNMIGCMDKATSGSVFITGDNVTDFSDRESSDFRREKIGFIFQHFYLIPVLTVYENIEFSLDLLNKYSDKEKKKQIMHILEEVEIPELAHRRPHELSGGQQQRVSIARALVKEPAIILADEPTANLDSVTGDAILKLMKKLNTEDNITFIFSSHNPEIIENASRVIWLRDGKIERIEEK